MYKPSTLKDIANGLGLAVSTVSRALYDSYQISEETKIRVREEAAKMNYKSNLLAASLKSLRNYSLGVVISNVDNIFFSQVINGIESVAYKKGYHVIITQSHDSSAREAENLKHLMDSRVDGILLSLAADISNYSHINECKLRGQPMVFFDRVLEDINADKVVSDNFKGAYDGTTQLIKSGCREIMFFGSVEHLSIIKERKSGYQQALQDNNRAVSRTSVRYCGFEEDYIQNIETVLTELKRADALPDAIFGACETSTLGCLRVLKKLKLDADIKVSGFCNTNLSELMSEPPGFIRQDAFKMGVIAAEKLINSIENLKYKENYETITLETG